MAVEVFAADEQDEAPVDAARWVRLAQRVLEAEGVAGDAELSMLFVDEGSMAELNKRFRDREGATDVLAFPIDEDAVERGRSPDSGGPGPGVSDTDAAELPLVLGDVVVCPRVAERNAPDHAGSYEDELALLVVHGILHLLGMDHEDDGDAKMMERRERELLELFYEPTSRA
jgi:probable rRNA maturation factor